MLKARKKPRQDLVLFELERHFLRFPLAELVTATRRFPSTARVDLWKGAASSFGCMAAD
jgi:hypothetical protein